MVDEMGLATHKHQNVSYPHFNHHPHHVSHSQKHHTTRNTHTAFVLLRLFHNLFGGDDNANAYPNTLTSV